MGENTAQEVTWRDVETRLEAAIGRMPNTTLRLGDAECVSPIYAQAHAILGGVTRDGNDHMQLLHEGNSVVGGGTLIAVNHIYHATQAAIQIAMQFHGGIRPVQTQDFISLGVLLDDHDRLKETIAAEMADVHGFSTHLGLCDPAGHILEITEIALTDIGPNVHSDPCPVWELLSKITSFDHLNMNLENTEVTRRSRGACDRRKTYERAFREPTASWIALPEYLRGGGRKPK